MTIGPNPQKQTQETQNEPKTDEHSSEASTPNNNPTEPPSDQGGVSYKAYSDDENAQKDND